MIIANKKDYLLDFTIVHSNINVDDFVEELDKIKEDYTLWKLKKFKNFEFTEEFLEYLEVAVMIDKDKMSNNTILTAVNKDTYYNSDRIIVTKKFNLNKNNLIVKYFNDIIGTGKLKKQLQKILKIKFNVKITELQQSLLTTAKWKYEWLNVFHDNPFLIYIANIEKCYEILGSSVFLYLNKSNLNDEELKDDYYIESEDFFKLVHKKLGYKDISRNELFQHFENNTSDEINKFSELIANFFFKKRKNPSKSEVANYYILYAILNKVLPENMVYYYFYKCRPFINYLFFELKIEIKDLHEILKLADFKLDSPIILDVDFDFIKELETTNKDFAKRGFTEVLNYNVKLTNFDFNINNIKLLNVFAKFLLKGNKIKISKNDNSMFLNRDNIISLLSENSEFLSELNDISEFKFSKIIQENILE